MTRLARLGRALTTTGSLGAAALTAHALLNARYLPTPRTAPPAVAERVAVCLPLRDEAHRLAPTLRSVLAQLRVPDLVVLVLDDGSTDGTADVVRAVAGGDPRVRLLAGGDGPLPEGWLGKPWACARLAEAAAQSDAEVLVFLDADVVLAPTAVAATVDLLRGQAFDLVSPYPRQLADGVVPRLVQPLLQWSWLSFLPLRLATTSPRESLAAANGQLLAVDADVYHRAGGHGAVRGEVVEDVALLRAVKRVGGRGGVADGTDLATCRMYASTDDLVEGYTKSLWSAFGSPAGAAATVGLLGLLYLVPPAAALRGSRVGLAGYAAGVAGRVVSARRTGGRSFPDALAHPASVALLARLTAGSVLARRRGTLSWKGRSL